jgi:hypothetical protein
MRSKGALHSGVYFLAALSAIRQCEGFIGRWVDGLVYDAAADASDERMMMMMVMMMIQIMMMMLRGSLSTSLLMHLHRSIYTSSHLPTTIIIIFCYYSICRPLPVRRYSAVLLVHVFPPQLQQIQRLSSGLQLHVGTVSS